MPMPMRRGAGLLLLFATLDVVQAATCDTSDWMVKDGSLRELMNNDALSFVFVGGKGGVGKTTTSSALAIQLARSRRERGAKGVLLISTDPAHSLGDAFRLSFGGEPASIEGVEGLMVMEVDPSILMEQEFRSWQELAELAGEGDIASKLSEMQHWFTSIPGVDEATALASVVDKMESGNFSLIVFDTAPTGHTLKLLAMPAVLDAGLSKLQSWSTKLWGYYESFTSLFRDPEDKRDPNALRREVEKKIQLYRDGMQKVSDLMRDTARTTFVTVCIAEHLSVAESRRLLTELAKNNIHTNHIVVNQLVVGGLQRSELDTLTHGGTEGIAKIAKSAGVGSALVAQLVAAAELCQAREAIQARHLATLSSSEEAACLDVVQVPLLPSEVTGALALARFSELLVAGRAHGLGSTGKVEL